MRWVTYWVSVRKKATYSREIILHGIMCEGTLLGTPNREPQEYSRNKLRIYLPGSLYSISPHYIIGVPCLRFPFQPFEFAYSPLTTKKFRAAVEVRNFLTSSKSRAVSLKGL